MKLSIPLKVTDYFSSGLQDENLLVGPEAMRSRCAEDMGFAVYKRHGGFLDQALEQRPCRLPAHEKPTDHTSRSINAMPMAFVVSLESMDQPPTNASGTCGAGVHPH